MQADRNHVFRGIPTILKVVGGVARRWSQRRLSQFNRRVIEFALLEPRVQ